MKRTGGLPSPALPGRTFPPYIAPVAHSSAYGALLIEGGDVVLPDRVVESGVVLISGGKILFAGPAENLPDPLPPHCRKIEVAGALVCPALWEPHIHGCGGFSTENGTRDSLLGIAKYLASCGVGAFVPTVVAEVGSLASLGEALESPGCPQELAGRVPGIHVEGPFVAPSRRGGIPERLMAPISLDYLGRLVALARGRIRVMTFAPELEGANALADRLSAMGILPSLGHSDARLEDLSRYEQVSPLCVTHLFNGMSGVSHKEPGLAQWALLNRDLIAGGPR